MYKEKKHQNNMKHKNMLWNKTKQKRKKDKI